MDKVLVAKLDYLSPSPGIYMVEAETWFPKVTIYPMTSVCRPWWERVCIHVWAHASAHLRARAHTHTHTHTHAQTNKIDV